MTSDRPWQSGTAVLLALGLTGTSLTAPLVIAPSPILAQSQATLTSGTIISTRSEKDKKILVTPVETAALTLVVDADVKAPLGAVLIPVGSTIKGQLQPARDGSQYVASQITLPDGKQFSLDATSQIVTRKETISKGPKATSILAGTAVGAGAAAALSALLGGGAKGITPWRVLAGAGAGALGGVFLGPKRKVELVSINPNEDLDLTLRSNLVITYP